MAVVRPHFPLQGQPHPFPFCSLGLPGRSSKPVLLLHSISQSQGADAQPPPPLTHPQSGSERPSLQPEGKETKAGICKMEEMLLIKLHCWSWKRNPVSGFALPRSPDDSAVEDLELGGEGLEQGKVELGRVPNLLQGP